MEKVVILNQILARVGRHVLRVSVDAGNARAYGIQPRTMYPAACAVNTATKIPVSSAGVCQRLHAYSRIMVVHITAKIGVSLQNWA